MCQTGACGCCGGASITLPIGQTGATGITPPINISNTVFVSKLGSDSTGLVQRLDYPFLTIAAALTAAATLTPATTKRITIVVFGGTYAENISMSQYVNIVSGVESGLLFNNNTYATIATKNTNALRPVYINGIVTQGVNNADFIGINCNTLAITASVTNCNFKNFIASTSITSSQTSSGGTWFDVHSALFLPLNTGTTMSGYYEKCTGGSTSFAGSSSAAAGTLTAIMTECIGLANCFASSSAGNGGSISGTLRKCRVTSSNSFGSSSSGDGGSLSGTFEDCEGTSNCFGSGSANGSTLSGTFRRCRGSSTSFGAGSSSTGGTLSGDFESCVVTSTTGFGWGGTTGGTLSGTFKNCYGDANCYGGSSVTAGTLSGNFFNCGGKDAIFACVDAVAAGTAGTISGIMENCWTTGVHSYASGTASGTPVAGTISGLLINCNGGAGNVFASSANAGGTVSSAGQLINCNAKIATADVLRKCVVSGRISGIRINQQNVNEPGIILATGATLTDFSIKGNGTASSIHASGAITAAFTRGRTFGKGYNSNVTNLVISPFIIDESTDIF